MRDGAGIPICLKDIYDTAGVVTAGGCYGLRDRVPAEDAYTVALMRSGGVVFVGKAYTVEFASGGLLNPQYRADDDGRAIVTPNPWSLRHQPGGSSSGTAAAVAGGQVLAGTGSCTGGSIRGPAAYCGLSGMKPTYGLCSKRGVLPLSKTLDHVGPICRTAEDCALFLDTIKGYDAADPNSLQPPANAPPGVAAGTSLAALLRPEYALAHPDVDVTVVVIPSMLRGCEPDVQANFEAALQTLKSELGCKIVEHEPLAGFDANAFATARSISRIEKAAYIK
eukprot:SAG31_NODE_3231_length_4514_cov_4.860249_4_plen_280_part_00